MGYIIDKLLTFPNVSAIASYLLISQTMNFTDLSKDHLDELVSQLNARDFEITTIDSASKIIHEASHYFDNLATLSGQMLLVKVYNALNEIEIGTENNSIIDLFNTIRAWKHDHYTTYLAKGIADPNYRNWTYNLNSGFGVDIFDNPNSNLCMFSNFKYRGESIGNVPFSIEALWETNAMWAEITYHANVAIMVKDKDLQTIEYHQVNRKYTDYLYNSEMLVYSHAAHLISSFLDLGDLYRAFKLSKAFSSISLNLPFCYYSQIKRPKGSIFGSITKKLLEHTHSLNPCAIFLTLLENIFEAKVDFFKNDNMLIEIDEILAISELPNKNILKADILKEMNQLVIDSENATFSEVYNVQKMNGIKIFDKYGIEGGLNIHPACFIDLANKSHSCVFQEDMEETDAYLRYDYYSGLEKHMRQAVEKIKGI